MQQQRGIVAISAKTMDGIYNFLQGLITNDIRILEKDISSNQPNNDHKNAIYSLMLTPNGRYLFDFFIIAYDRNTVLVDIHKEYVTDFIAKLNLYKLRAKVEIKDITGVNYNLEAIYYKDPRNANMPDRHVCKDIIYDDEYDYQRIDNIVVDGFCDMTQNKSIPLEFRMDEQNAISFDKGCYMGQELISRTKHTGIVRKNVFKLQIINPIDNKNISKGADVFNEHNQKIGNICSMNKDLGLAKLKIDALLTSPEQEFYIEHKNNLIKIYH